MAESVTISISHRLGKAEASRRLRVGLGRMQGNLGSLVAIEQEIWSGDTLQFQMRALGQSATGTVEVLEESVRIEVALPWLLARLSERLIPAIRKEATRLLEKKS